MLSRPRDYGGAVRAEGDGIDRAVVRQPRQFLAARRLEQPRRVVLATVMDRHMPTFIVILTTIRCHPSLAQNDLAKPSSGINRKNSRWCHHDAHVQFDGDVLPKSWAAAANIHRY